MYSVAIRRILMLLGCSPLLAALAQPITQAPIKLSFGVVPQEAVTEMARKWTPIMAYLSRKTGYSIQFKSAPDIRTFENRVEAGEFDLAYFNPLHYATYRVNGYQAIAREKDVQLTGIIVVRKSSTLQDLKGLDGTTMAFPSSTAFAATVLPAMSLKQLGISVVPKYVSSHESVYRTVAQGLYPAGGGIVKTYEQVDPAVREQLRILWKTQTYTPHPVAVHPRISRQVVMRVTDAMVGMANDPQGAAILKLSGINGFIAAKDGDYDDIRALNMDIGSGGKVDYGK